LISLYSKNKKEKAKAKIDLENFEIKKELDLLKIEKLKEDFKKQKNKNDLTELIKKYPDCF
jgi:hypothetical protein